ncbi:MAG: hypothetical protein JSU87_14110 [Gemmatimonadota bacterium]|nr:MAG: hypothetical protein JSU87_14110 [Gemmatimonadota bacterium]
MKRRFAYIYLMVGPAPGVEQKINDQAVSLDRSGNTDLQIIVINPSLERERGALKHVRVPRNSLTNRLGYALRRFRLIEDAIDCDAYDLLLLRYPMADGEAAKFAGRHKVVSEHHTKEVEERRAQLRSHLPYLQRLHKRVSLQQEVRYGPRYLGRCTGIVAVSDETRLYQLNRSGSDLPSLTMPNGILVDRVSHTRFRLFDGSTLHLAFLGGRGSPWHGTDRLLRSLSAYRGRTPIKVHLLGALRPPVGTLNLPQNVDVEFHGTLLGSDADTLLSRTNLAISSLALFECDLGEISTLKTREYTARGLPFVIGHVDPDLRPVPEAMKFFLSVPNDDSLIDMDGLIEFAERMAAREPEDRISDFMRDYARQHMEWGPKLQGLIEFMRGL